MPTELTINAVPVGDRCLFPTWEKTAVNEAEPIGGVWEETATFEDFSPAFYYVVRFQVIVVEGFTCPEDVKVYISKLRDLIGEGPFVGIFDGASKYVSFANLRWAGPPSVSDAQQRYELFSIEFYTDTEPVVS